MKQERLDAENRTPVFAVPQNSSDSVLKTENVACEPGQPEEKIADFAGKECLCEPPLPPKALPQSEPFFTHTAQKWAVPGSLVLGYLYWRVLVFGHGKLQLKTFSFAWPLPVFVLVFYTAVTVFLRFFNPKLQNKEKYLWLGCLALSALGMGLQSFAAVPQILTLLLVHFFAVYWAAACTGQLTANKTGPFCVWDALRAVGFGFAGLVAWPRAVWQLLRSPHKKCNRQNLGATVLCLLAAIPLLVMAVRQLCAADAGFQKLVQSLFRWRFDRWFTESFSYFLLALPTGAFFYGLVVGGAQQAKQQPRLQTSRVPPQGLRVVPASAVTGVLAVFCSVYLLFFAVQGGYLFGAFSGRLPVNFTVADYARQGFFELCRVMLLNLLVLCGVYFFSQKKWAQGGVQRCAATVLLAQSLLLWATAAAKLGLYIGTFGFTSKRLLAAWALLVLAVAAVRCLASLYQNCTVVRPTVLVGACTLAALCLV